MCTVTFLPTTNGPIITSSRDEKYTRPAALPPAITAVPPYQLVKPVDALAGGTWIAARSDGQVGVLLNGAFTNHIANGNYAKSRGILLNEIMTRPQPIASLHQLNLTNIAPFTLIGYNGYQLHEYRWNAETLFHQQLDNGQPYIWSSATLYPPAAIMRRQQWFTQWFTGATTNSHHIWQFHTNGGSGDARNSICMNRPNDTRTVSITMVQLNNGQVIMDYADVLSGQRYTKSIAYMSPIIS